MTLVAARGLSRQLVIAAGNFDTPYFRVSATPTLAIHIIGKPMINGETRRLGAASGCSPRYEDTQVGATTVSTLGATGSGANHS
jgi:hypothetical protein